LLLLPNGHQSRLLIPIAVIFTGILIVSNIVAIKMVNFEGVNPFGAVYFPGAVIIFPISYIFGDILAEVYGFRVARVTIWSAFLANIIAVFSILIVMEMPSAPFWHDQDAYEAILGPVWRIVLGSFLAFIVGEFANTYVLVRMKKITDGRFLWMRTIASTIVGQGIDTAIFASVAFGGTAAFQGGTLIWQEWMAKVIYEAIGTPLTYLVVNFLKKHEGIDTFDADDVSYNPFKIWA